MADVRELQQLVARVDAKVAEIRAHRPVDVTCHAGCHACCAPGLTVTAVEAAAIALWLQAHPEVESELEELARAAPWGETRCAFLRADGQCAVYVVRPIVCRTQGLPVVVDGGAVSVCGLNFSGGLADLAPGDRLDQQTVSTVLFVIDQRFGGGARRPLTLAGVREEI